MIPVCKIVIELFLGILKHGKDLLLIPFDLGANILMHLLTTYPSYISMPGIILVSIIAYKTVTSLYKYLERKGTDKES